MTTPAVVIPPRRWDDEPVGPEPVPVVLVSSRDNAPVPHVAGAARLAALAGSHGWTARLTYALAEVPATGRKAAHTLASVVLRLARGAVRGWAAWESVDFGSWSFAVAYFGTARHWLLAGKLEHPTVAGRLAEGVIS